MDIGPCVKESLSSQTWCLSTVHADSSASWPDVQLPEVAHVVQSSREEEFRRSCHHAAVNSHLKNGLSKDSSSKFTLSVLFSFLGLLPQYVFYMVKTRIILNQRCESDDYQVPSSYKWCVCLPLVAQSLPLAAPV